LKDGQGKLGASLRRLRLAKGMTQRELASPFYTHAYISTIEAGRRQPSPTAMKHFADKLGIDVDDLASGRPAGLVRELEAALADARIAASDGRFEMAEAALSSAARRARRYGLRRVEARAHEIRGLILERSGRPEAALEEYEAAERLLHDAEPAASVDAVAGKARSLQALGDTRYAIFVLESLKRLMPIGADVSSLAHIRAALLDAYLDAGLVRAAEDVGRELERLEPRLHDAVREGQVHLYLARLRVTQGRPREADRLLAAAAEAYESSGLRTETAYAYLARGCLLSREDKLAAAERDLQRARRVFEETRNEKELNNTMIELARVERVRGRFEQAHSLLNDVIDRLRGGNAQLLAWAHRELGLLFSDREHARSEKHLRIAVELFDRADETIETATTYRILGDVLRADGQEQAALEAYSTGIHRLPASP
jgi:tetratricopeptide (TPR) repeat protein